MASLNKVIIIGNAGRDAELRYLANGTAQASFSVATSRNYKGQDGNWQEQTEWFNVVAWAELAERISQTVTKGKQVYVEGRLQTRSWDNNEGVKQTRTEVVAQTILLMGRAEPREGGAAAGGAGGWSDDAGFQRGGSGATGGNRPRPANAGGGGFRSGGGEPESDPDDLPFE